MNLTENEKQLVIGIISDTLGVKIEKITPDLKLNDDLGADSLDAVDIVMRLESEFDISIPDDDYSNTVSVSGIFDIVDRYLN